LNNNKKTLVKNYKQKKKKKFKNSIIKKEAHFWKWKKEPIELN